MTTFALCALLFFWGFVAGFAVARDLYRSANP